ncbi:MAG TPA: phosphatidylserine/phosphatidylglycerophosphate/cardiolipin synthase family protein [Gaiellaceae bacterium]|nr:phosphatidylserine/phosphatidylglycerophosphate/cardiolipin synthase family protein [Gaiellaceae bacterium]
MAPYPLNRVDDLVGETLERIIRAKHARRLRRHGSGGAVDPPADGGWASTASFAPRPGCRVEPFVDGSEALPRIAGAIRSARSHVHLAGWHFDPTFRLEEGGQTLRELLADAAERVGVRVLAWAGAPLPLFHPDRGEMRQACKELAGGTRISMALDARERPFHCHHEKLVVVDDEAAFVGGIDLTALAGDRLDSSEHPPRDGLGWHDTALRLEGPVVDDVAEHFRLRWHAVAGGGLPSTSELRSAAVPGGIEAHFVRTVPERLYEPCRDGEWSILESYLRALRAAERLVYLESQFLWAPELTFVLAEKLRRPPRDDFRVIALLPAHPNNGADDSRGQVGLLIDADKKSGDDTTRFLACTLYQPGPGGNPVYVHSKAAVIDDTWLTVGSANLNAHSLFNDTEANVVVRHPELAREVRLRLWEEHLERPRAEIDGDPARVFDELWKPLAEERLERRRRDGWADGKLTLLPHVSRRTEAFWGPLNGLFVDG